MSALVKKPKGILKKTVSIEQEAADHQPAKPSAEARELAIQHATIIQDRKNLESQILDSIVSLSEYPRIRTEGFSAATPAPRDVADFKSGVRLFQPSDYDALVEERNANNLCGYTLCARPRVTYRGNGQWKLTGTGIAQRKELEKWCSKDCAKRALYVKVQLNETAAWERAGIPDIEIDLFGEHKPPEDATTQAIQDLERLRLQDEKAAKSSALARERGDVASDPAPSLLKLTIREKETKAPKQGVSFSEGDPNKNEDHLIVEGHKLKFGVQGPKGHSK